VRSSNILDFSNKRAREEIEDLRLEFVDCRLRRVGDRRQKSEVGGQMSEDRDYTVVAAFFDMPVPGVISGSLSKLSRNISTLMMSTS
jgi:hypothetical protein